MKALVVGGTGPTGPFIVKGLLQRGYEVAILHRGKHELDEIPPEVEHIHTDPHFLETLQPALEGRTFDVAVATYGRLRFVAEALVGKTGRFISVGGTPYHGMVDPARTFPRGELVPVPENRPMADDTFPKTMARLVAAAERSAFEHHPNATHFRYPYIYGPHQLIPREWCFVRRILDKRPFIVLPDGGWALHQHGYAENMAHAILLAVDQPDIAAGKSYNCADEQQMTLRQMVEVVARELGREIEIVSVPLQYASVARPLIMMGQGELNMLDIYKVRSELGYRDVVPPVEAFARTARWLVEHPLEPGGQLEGNLHDSFDYEAEDRLVRTYRSAMAKMSEFAWEVMERPHAYAHPKKVGEEDHRGR